MTYRPNCRSRSRGIHSHSARNNSESNNPTIQTTTLRPTGGGYHKGIQSLPHHPTTRTRKATNHTLASRNAMTQTSHLPRPSAGSQNHPKVLSLPPMDMAAGLLPDHVKNVKMGRISPSPSRAFTPHYSHSLNSIPSITSLTTRTFTLSSSRSLKNLKIHTLTT